VRGWIWKYDGDIGIYVPVRGKLPPPLMRGPVRPLKEILEDIADEYLGPWTEDGGGGGEW
jgi:hypothetical protein